MDNARLGILDEKLENLTTQSIQLSLYHKIMTAKTVEELRNLHLDLSGVLEVFSNVSLLVTIGENDRLIPDMLAGILEYLPPAKHNRRLFI